MTQGLKYDTDKPMMYLLPTKALVEVTKVLDFGAKKYAPHNWRKGIQYSRLLSASLRHITSFNDGEDIDKETNISHIAHATCCLLFLLEQQLTVQTELNSHLDDRYKHE